MCAFVWGWLFDLHWGTDEINIEIAGQRAREELDGSCSMVKAKMEFWVAWLGGRNRVVDDVMKMQVMAATISRVGSLCAFSQT